VTLLSCVRKKSGTYVGAGHAPPAARNQHAQLHQNTKRLCHPCRGRPMCRPAEYKPLSPTGAHTGAPLQGRHGCVYRSHKRAGRPSADRRSDLQGQTPTRHPAKRSGVQGHCPCRARKRAGAPAGGPRRSVYATPNSVTPPAKRSGVQGHCPCRSGKRAGAPAGGPRRSVYATPNSVTHLREAVRGAGALPLPACLLDLWGEATV